MAALYEAAKKEGELTWYTVPYTSETAERIGRTFTARYPGVKVNVVRTTAQVAFQRLNQDLKAGTPNCDVFTSTDLAHYVDLKARKLLLKYRPAAVALQDKRVQNMDPDDYFHASSAFMMGLVYNTAKVQRRGHSEQLDRRSPTRSGAVRRWSRTRPTAARRVPGASRCASCTATAGSRSWRRTRCTWAARPSTR